MEAALVGATIAIVFLILRPGAPALSPQVWPDDILYRPPEAAASAPQPPVVGYDDVGHQVSIHGPPAAGGSPIAGASSVHVVDGDGLEIDGLRIRLHGIDAFEYDQQCGGSSCGAAARAALSDLVRGRDVECRPVDVDRYGRTVARCYADGQDLGAAMVRDGMALAYRRYGQDYVDEEASAQRARAGAWAGDFQNPEDWRRSSPRG